MFEESWKWVFFSIFRTYAYNNQLELLCCPLFSPDIIGAVYPLGLAATVKESKLAAGVTSIVDVGPLVVKVSKSNLIVHISEK